MCTVFVLSCVCQRFIKEFHDDDDDDDDDVNITHQVTNLSVASISTVPSTFLRLLWPAPTAAAATHMIQ